jgi:hypothetical protein
MLSRFPSAAQISLDLVFRIYQKIGAPKTTRGDDKNNAAEYARRCVSADAGVKTVASGDVVDYGFFK